MLTLPAKETKNFLFKETTYLLKSYGSYCRHTRSCEKYSKFMLIALVVNVINKLQDISLNNPESKKLIQQSFPFLKDVQDKEQFLSLNITSVNQNKLNINLSLTDKEYFDISFFEPQMHYSWTYKIDIGNVTHKINDEEILKDLFNILNIKAKKSEIEDLLIYQFQQFTDKDWEYFRYVDLRVFNHNFLKPDTLPDPICFNVSYNIMLNLFKNRVKDVFSYSYYSENTMKRLMDEINLFIEHLKFDKHTLNVLITEMEKIEYSMCKLSRLDSFNYIQLNVIEEFFKRNWDLIEDSNKEKLQMLKSVAQSLGEEVKVTSEKINIFFNEANEKFKIINFNRKNLTSAFPKLQSTHDLNFFIKCFFDYIKDEQIFHNYSMVEKSGFKGEIFVIYQEGKKINDFNLIYLEDAFLFAFSEFLDNPSIPNNKTNNFLALIKNKYQELVLADKITLSNQEKQKVIIASSKKKI